MLLQTGEIREFRLLMLIPPGNIQQEIEQFRRTMIRTGCIDFGLSAPPWIPLDWNPPDGQFPTAWSWDQPCELSPAFSEDGATLVLNAIKLPEPRVLPGGGPLGGGPPGSGPPAGPPQGGAPPRGERLLDAHAAGMRPGTIRLGTVRAEHEPAVRQAPTLKLRFASGRLALVSFHSIIAETSQLSWQLETSVFVKAAQRRTGQGGGL